MKSKSTYNSGNIEYQNEGKDRNNQLLLYENFQDYESFLAEVYQQMFQSLFHYGMQICGNKDLVKDCIQELFSELWQNQKSITKIKSVKPYLLKCYKRKIKRELGKGKRLFVEGSFEFETSHELKLIQDQQQLRKKQLLKIALESLTERQREAIYLKFYINLSYEEVAQVLNIKTKATYKLVYRAISMLKVAMNSFD